MDGMMVKQPFVACQRKGSFQSVTTGKKGGDDVTLQR